MACGSNKYDGGRDSRVTGSQQSRYQGLPVVIGFPHGLHTGNKVSKQDKLSPGSQLASP